MFFSAKTEGTKTSPSHHFNIVFLKISLSNNVTGLWATQNVAGVGGWVHYTLSWNNFLTYILNFMNYLNGYFVRTHDCKSWKMQKRCNELFEGVVVQTYASLVVNTQPVKKLLFLRKGEDSSPSSVRLPQTASS